MGGAGDDRRRAVARWAGRSPRESAAPPAPAGGSPYSLLEFDQLRNVAVCAKRASGYDADKKVKGRKRHVAVATHPLMLAVTVHSARMQELQGAPLVVDEMATAHGHAPLRCLRADGGYVSHRFAAWVRATTGAVLEIVSRAPGQRGFKAPPKRWVVERTFARRGRYWSLSEDYEQSPQRVWR